jgi:hypothetical protein
VRTIRLRDNELVESEWIERLNDLRRRFGLSRPVRLLKSALVEVPTVIGWLRPVILLPAASLTGLTPGQLEAILAHELAHVRRFDYLVNAFQCLVETLMFYHPVVWWISRCVREERENCCDDLVIKVCGDRLEYARALATLEEFRAELPQLAFAASGGSLLNRIRRLLGVSDDNQPASARQLGELALLGIGLVLILMTSLLVLVWGQQRPVAGVYLLPRGIQTNSTGTLCMLVAVTNRSSRTYGIGFAIQTKPAGGWTAPSLIKHFDACSGEQLQPGSGIEVLVPVPQTRVPWRVAAAYFDKDEKIPSGWLA